MISPSPPPQPLAPPPVPSYPPSPPPFTITWSSPSGGNCGASHAEIDAANAAGITFSSTTRHPFIDCSASYAADGPCDHQGIGTTYGGRNGGPVIVDPSGSNTVADCKALCLVTPGCRAFEGFPNRGDSASGGCSLAFSCTSCSSCSWPGARWQLQIDGATVSTPSDIGLYYAAPPSPSWTQHSATACRATAGEVSDAQSTYGVAHVLDASESNPVIFDDSTLSYSRGYSTRTLDQCKAMCAGTYRCAAIEFGASSSCKLLFACSTLASGGSADVWIRG